MGLLVAVAEDDELELGAGVRGPAALREPCELAAQDLARRGDHVGTVVPDDVGEAHRRPLLPGHAAQRVEVRAHHEVAVAALPRGHRVALDGRHVDVDREQVVAALGAVLGDLIDEVPGDQALAHQAPLHVGDREEHRVDCPRARPPPSAPRASSPLEGTGPEPFRAIEMYRARATVPPDPRRSTNGAAARASAESKDRDHRRRRRRRLDRLPPRGARRARRHPARPRRADQRLDLPLRRPRRPTARKRLADPDDDVQRRALRDARVRLGAVRRHPAGVHARARAGGAPPGGMGEDVRAAAGAPRARARPGALPADGDRRRALRAPTSRPTATSTPRS